ncbi:M48 family metallopeptidase [Salidesulfovibrio onnuriiensis]|uniref:M48 family metallopeptidase n=1 Tax=Salidesulfovibrio onnuriiensis TaxID=2583823 RepID=UPI0011CA57B8|nr:M48 family metallopeptidase [Salidesulfovibrio onnuriiensis]
MGLRNRGYSNNVNISPGSPILDFIKLGIGVVVILGGLYFLFGLGIDFIVPRLDTETEVWLSERLKTDAFEHGKRLPEAERELQRMVDRMCEACVDLPYDVRVHVVDNDMVNAFAFPGGRIVVFSGLLKQMKSENEVAFVLGHELGHMAHRDHLRRFGRLLFVAGLQTILSDLLSVDMVTEAMTLTDRAFSRQQELAADRAGMDILACTYGHVGGAGAFFESMEEGRRLPAWKKYYLTHPEGYRRVEALGAYAESRGYGSGEVRVLPEAFR